MLIINSAPTEVEYGVKDGRPNYAHAYFSLRDYMDKIPTGILPGENFYPPASNDNEYWTGKWLQQPLIVDTPSSTTQEPTSSS